MFNLNYFLLFSLPLYIIITVFKRNVLLLLLLISFAYFGSLFYEVFPQAFNLYLRNSSIIYWIFNWNVHSLRLLIVSPSILATDLFGFNIHLTYTVYVILLIYFIGYFIQEIYQLYFGKLNNFKSIVLQAILLVIAFSVNGRLIFSFFGFTLILLFISKLHLANPLRIQDGFLLLFGFLLTNVSSGTFLIGLIIFVFFIFIRSFQNFSKKFIFFLLFMSLVGFILFGDYILLLIQRNTNYYGGGFEGFILIFNHGITQEVLTFEQTFLLLLVLLPLIVINFLWLIGNIKSRVFPLEVFISILFYSFFLGISTGIMILIPILVYFLHYLNFNLKLNI